MPEVRSYVQLHYTEMHSGLFQMFTALSVRWKNSNKVLHIHSQTTMASHRCGHAHWFNCLEILFSLSHAQTHTHTHTHTHTSGQSCGSIVRHVTKHWGSCTQMGGNRYRVWMWGCLCPNNSDESWTELVIGFSDPSASADTPWDWCIVVFGSWYFTLVPLFHFLSAQKFRQGLSTNIKCSESP